MKNIYFGNGLNNELKKVIYFTSSLAYKIAPKMTLQTSKRLLLNPYGQRDVALRSIISTDEIKVKSLLGDINLYKFGDGNKHVLLVHGWADNIKCFQDFIPKLLAQGYTVWAFDQIGHGKSEGDRSHLFGFIDGLKSVIKMLESKGVFIESLIAHSMGAVSILNLDKEFLATKKIVFISVPANLFEDMFEKIARVGISDKILHGVLESISLKYNLNWRLLHPKEHKDKVHQNILFIHDEDDQFCRFENVQNYVEDLNVRLIKTKSLGHRRILKDRSVIEESIRFIGDKIE